jgi:phosphoglycerate dehydrogenase-like enzyme
MRKIIKLVMLIDEPMIMRMFTEEMITYLKSFAEIMNENNYQKNITIDYMKKWLPDADVCFTCWGTPLFTREILDCAPNLKVILHGAGTPKAIVTDAVFERGIRVATAAPVIAIDVAETTLGAMIYCLKHMAEYSQVIQNKQWDTKYSDGGQTKINQIKAKSKRLNKHLKVGIVSCSHVGKNLLKFLKPFDVTALLYDPLISKEEARKLGCALVSLEELMETCDVVSVHTPNIPVTQKMITAKHLSLMKDGALFINTSRGTVIDQTALINILRTGRIYAYLDVYDTEPLPNDNELISLENVLLSPHISGGHTVNGGFERGEYLIEQLFTYKNIGVLKDETMYDMLETMA